MSRRNKYDKGISLDVVFYSQPFVLILGSEIWVFVTVQDRASDVKKSNLR